MSITHTIKMAILDRLALTIIGLWTIVIGLIAPKFTMQTLMDLCASTKEVLSKEPYHD